jgi:hypothetical protein
MLKFAMCAFGSIPKNRSVKANPGRSIGEAQEIFNRACFAGQKHGHRSSSFDWLVPWPLMLLLGHGVEGHPTRTAKLCRKRLNL